MRRGAAAPWRGPCPGWRRIAGVRESCAARVPVVLTGLAMAATQYALAVGGVWHVAGFGGGLAGLAGGFVLARSTRRPSRPSSSEVGPGRLVVITLAVQFIVPLRAVLGSVVIQAQFPAVATGLGVLTPAEPGKSLVLLRHAGAILVYTAALTYFILLRARGVPPRAPGRLARGTA